MSRNSAKRRLTEMGLFKKTLRLFGFPFRKPACIGPFASRPLSKSSSLIERISARVDVETGPGSKDQTLRAIRAACAARCQGRRDNSISPICLLRSSKFGMTSSKALLRDSSQSVLISTMALSMDSAATSSTALDPNSDAAIWSSSIIWSGASPGSCPSTASSLRHALNSGSIRSVRISLQRSSSPAAPTRRLASLPMTASTKESSLPSKSWIGTNTSTRFR